MTSKFAFTSVRNGLEQLEGVLALHALTNLIRKGCMEDLREALTALPKETKVSEGIHFKYQYSSSANYEVSRWIKLIDTDDTYAITRLDLEGANVHPTVDPAAADLWQSVLDSLQALQRAAQSFHTASMDHRRLGSDIGDQAKILKDVKALRGCYVHLNSSRRDTIGWVVSGRGNTAHVLRDRWGSKDPLQLDTPPVVSHLPGVSDMDLNTQRTEEWRLDSTGTITVILPPRTANMRKLAVVRWEELAKESYNRARAAWTKREEWQRDGGKEAAARRNRIQAVVESNTALPKMRDYYSSDELKRWFRIAIEVAGGEEVVRGRVLINAVAENGGELTPAELDILAKEPTDVPNDFSDLWEKEWNKSLNPDQEEAQE